MKQKRQRVRPKVPNWPQESREQRKEQRRAPRCSQKRIDAQLPLGSIQTKQKQCRRGAQAVSAVQRPGGPGQAEAEGTKQIMGHADGQPQQNGLEEYLQLLVNKVPHIIPAAAAAALSGPRTAPHRRGSRFSRPLSTLRPPETAARCAGPPL